MRKRYVFAGGTVFPFDVERSAFFGGFGDGSALLESLRATNLVMPLDVEGSVFTWVWRGLPWLVAFTTVERCATFAEAAGRDLEAIEVCTVRGAAVIEGMDRAPEPTGLVVDPASTDVMVFPPARAITPHCYIDEETGEAVRTWAA
ncbi:MAG: SseB family protein [Mycolicibacterium mageritense]|uniref:SseB family protein n=1 Tax=Mycolicibacterium mageritense TaxID=53462 RepID=A0AAI8XMV6_MYCME|nr:MAG: SseB family protein [Mycolicibacterium mageritense]BDY28242.1 hypothetical protein hbim_02173 [Mycolicibacterium mageritense]